MFSVLKFLFCIGKLLPGIPKLFFCLLLFLGKLLLSLRKFLFRFQADICQTDFTPLPGNLDPHGKNPPTTPPPPLTNTVPDTGCPFVKIQLIGTGPDSHHSVGIPLQCVRKRI